MAKLSTDDLLDAFKEMTLIELSEFVKKFEDTFEVTAAAPVAVAGAVPAAAAGGGDAAAAAEQDEFDVVLESAGDKKIQVIKEVRARLRSRSEGGQGPRRRPPSRSWRRSTRRPRRRPRLPSRAPAPPSRSRTARATRQAFRPSAPDQLDYRAAGILDAGRSCVVRGERADRCTLTPWVLWTRLRSWGAILKVFHPALGRAHQFQTAQRALIRLG